MSAAWTTQPVRAHHGEILRVVAADSNDVITEVDVIWGDGVVTFATLVCQGRVATVRLDHRYQRAGAYVVQIVAISSNRCSGGGQQESAPYLVPTLVV